MPRLRSFSLSILCMLFFLSAPLPGKADESAVSVGVGGSVSTSPYKGYDTQVMPFPVISYEGEYFYIRDLTAGIKIFRHDNFELSALVGYDPAEFDPDDSSEDGMRRLNSRWSSAVAGANLCVFTPYGDIQVRVTGDVLGHSNGFSGSVGYSNSIEYGLAEFTLDVGTYWASADYNDYYYGVSDREAKKSGLDGYDAGAGISPYLGITAALSFYGNWTAFCKGEVVFLGDSVKDSPMVDESTTQSLSFGFMYSF